MSNRTLPHSVSASVVAFLAAGTLAGCLAAAPGDETAAIERSVAVDTQRTGNPVDVRITTSGDDCPLAFAATPSPDFEAITFLFSETLLSDERRSVHCRIGIDYEFPAGWQLWRPAAIGRGVQILGDGERIAWALRTRLDGGAWVDTFATDDGPIDEDVALVIDDGEQRGEEPTACGATSAHLEVELFGALFAGPATDSALATLDSIDTAIDWQRCP